MNAKLITSLDLTEEFNESGTLFSRNGTRIWHLRNSILASVGYRKLVSDMRDEIMTLDIYSDSTPRDKRAAVAGASNRKIGTGNGQSRLAADLTAAEDLTTNARRRELR